MEHSTSLIAAEEISAVVDPWPFQKVKHVLGHTRALGHKTVKSDVTTWRGRFNGRTIEFVAQARLADASAHFTTSSNARIRGVHAASGAQFLDVEVTNGELTSDESQQLADVVQREVLRGGTDWSVQVRAKGQPVRSGVRGQHEHPRSVV